MNSTPVANGILIDRIANAFEQSWHSGERQEIEDLIAAHREIPADALLFELLMVELELRVTAGESIFAETYLQRFATNGQIVRKAFAESNLHSPALDRTDCQGSADTDPASQPGLFSSADTARKTTSINDSVTSFPANNALRRVGNYEILNQIGEGGMGIVYRARQTNLDRDVALKVIRSGQLASDEERRRFQNEARAAARLDHPNIVSAFDSGECDGVGYLAMPFVDGITLRDRISHGTFGAPAAAECTLCIARAIAYAHQHGILHRDLKPTNILLRTLDDQPLVTDFGLARLLGAEDHVTKTGQILGTPQFMPPEQAGDGTGTTDQRSDVYSLGALLYYILTGKPPFQGATPLLVVEKVLKEDPVAPSSIDESIPRDLETICLKSLRKNPDERYPTADALAEDLERFLSGRPILARPVPQFQRAVKWCRRNPWPTTVIMMTVILLAMATSAAVESRQQSERDRATKDAALLAKEDSDDARIESVGLQLTSRLAAFSAHNSPEIPFPAEIQSIDTGLLKRFLPRPLIPTRRFLGGEWGLFDARLNVDGRRLIAVDQSGLIILWDVQTGKKLAQLSEGLWSPEQKTYLNHFHFENNARENLSPEVFFSVDWLADDAIVVATSHGRILKINIADKQQSVIAEHQEPIHFVRRDPESGNLLLCSATGGLHLLDATGTVLATDTTTQSMPTCVSFEPAGRYWIVGYLDGSLTVLSSQLHIIATARMSGSVRDIVGLRRGDNSLIFCAAENEGIRQWLLQPDSRQLSEELHFDSKSRSSHQFFQSLVIDPKANRLMAFDNHGFITTWNTSNQVVISTCKVTRFDDRRYTLQKSLPQIFQRSTTDLFITGPEEILCLEKSGVGITLDTGSLNPPKLWSALTTQIGTNPDIVPASGDGNQFWLLDSRGELTLLDVARDRIVDQLSDAHPGGTPNLVRLADGTLVSVSGNKQIRFWDTGPNGIRETRRIEHSEDLISLAVDNQMKQIATVTRSAKLLLWDLINGRILHTVDLGDSRSGTLTGRVAFSMDARYVAAFGAYQQFGVFDSTNDCQRISLNGGYVHPRALGGTAMIWSPTKPDRLALSDEHGASGSWISGAITPSAAARINNSIAEDEVIVDFTPTHDGRRILGLTTAGHLLFLTSEHFTRTLTLDCGMRDCCAVAVDDAANCAVIVSKTGQLRVARFSSVEQMPETLGPALTGTRHPLLVSDDQKNFSSRRVRRDSGGRGVVAGVMTSCADHRTGDAFLIRRRESIWRLDPVRLPPQFGTGLVWRERPNVGFSADGSCVLAFRQMIPPVEDYDGQLLLGYEQPDGSWNTESVMDHGNAALSPLLCFDNDGQVSSVLHFSYEGMDLLQSIRVRNGLGEWPWQIVKPATGLNLDGILTKDGVIHAAMSRARGNSDSAPSEYLRLKPGGDPEFLPAPGGQIDVLSDGSPIVIQRCMMLFRLVDGDWRLWTQLPGGDVPTRSLSSAFVAADDSIWIADYRKAHGKVFLWRFFENNWTAIPLLADFPGSAAPDQIWIEGHDRIAIVFRGEVGVSGERTIDIIDALLPEVLRPTH